MLFVEPLNLQLAQEGETAQEVVVAGWAAEAVAEAVAEVVAGWAAEVVAEGEAAVAYSV